MYMLSSHNLIKQVFYSDLDIWLMTYTILSHRQLVKVKVQRQVSSDEWFKIYPFKCQNVSLCVLLITRMLQGVVK